MKTFVYLTLGLVLGAAALLLFSFAVPALLAFDKEAMGLFFGGIALVPAVGFGFGASVLLKKGWQQNEHSPIAQVSALVTAVVLCGGVYAWAHYNLLSVTNESGETIVSISLKTRNQSISFHDLAPGAKVISRFKTDNDNFLEISGLFADGRKFIGLAGINGGPALREKIVVGQSGKVKSDDHPFGGGI